MVEAECPVFDMLCCDISVPLRDGHVRLLA